jgi:hypothetical protein
VSKEFDTSWFNLKNYEILKKLSIDGWAEVISTRYLINYYYHIHINNSNDHQSQLFSKELNYHLILKKVATIKNGIVTNNEDVKKGRKYNVSLDKYSDSFGTISVNSISSYQLNQLATDKNLSKVWKACKHKQEVEESRVFYDEDIIPINPDETLFKIAESPHDTNIRERFGGSGSLAYVSINLSATDEQIKKDFNHWLTNYRKVADHHSEKKLFKQTNFDHWIKIGVIPYLDLVLIAKIEGKKITQNKLARMIFPDEYDVDTVGRIRQVTKPEAEKLIKNKIHVALSAQSAYEKTG